MEGIHADCEGHGEDYTMAEASENTAADTLHSRAIRLPALETTQFPLIGKITAFILRVIYMGFCIGGEFF